MAAVLQRRHGVGGEATPSGKAVELDPDEIDQLRALGYSVPCSITRRRQKSNFKSKPTLRGGPT